MQGNFEISAIEGNIVWPGNDDNNKKSQVTVLVSGTDGQIRGGPVRSLIAKSSIKVLVHSHNPPYIYSFYKTYVFNYFYGYCMTSLGERTSKKRLMR